MTDLIQSLRTTAIHRVERDPACRELAPCDLPEWEAADEIERFRSVLTAIASCESHHPDDVVAIARKALKGES